jgi:adenylate cyclase
MLEMQIALGAPLIATRGYAAAPVRACFNRARELSELVGKTQERSHIHRGLAAFYLIRADLAVARRLAEDSLVQAELDDDEGQLLEAHSWLGTILFYMAEISLARLQFDAALRIYDERRHHLHATRYGLDPAILCLVHLIWTRWLDGETEAAVETELETLALASRLGHPLSLAHALNFSAVHRQFRAEAAETQRFVVQEIALSQEHHLPHYAAYATILSGWVCAARGDPSRGVRLIMQGLDARRETGAELAKPFFLTLLAQAQQADGNVKAALDALAEAEEVMGRTAERWWEPEVHRLRGELLTAAATSAADLRDAEGSLRRALETARRHGCPALEARANGSLSRLLLGS